MRKLKRFLAGVLCGICLIHGSDVSVLAVEYKISPCYEQEKTVNTYLSFEKKTVSCTLRLRGKSGTKKIEGTLKLYDETSKKTVKTWDISVEKSYYSTSKNVTVKKGHTYTLSFSGKAYDKDGKSEKISGSTTKEN